MNNKFRLYKRCAEFYDDLYTGEKLSKKQLNRIRKVKKALFVKNIYNFDCPQATDNWYIIRDRYYDIEEYESKNTRKQLRKSLSVYEYKRINKQEMLSKGYQVYVDSSTRFKKKAKAFFSMDEYYSYIQKGFDEGREFWGGYDRATGEMAMWEEIYIKGDMVVENKERLSYRFTKHNPTYGLNHEIAKHYLTERGYRYLNAGSRSFDGHSNVQNFLIDKLQFRRAYCQVQLYFPQPLRSLIILGYPFLWLLRFFPYPTVSSIFKMILATKLSI
ncbi:MAG: hypothetical protein MR676_03485 [Porphyromonas sp.]|nr:hypothetical protein [Porphyromonas sp.]